MTERNSTQQIAALTTVRGLAAWWVVLYHIRDDLPMLTQGVCGDILSHGFLAVDLFFVLSGFVISLSYSQQFERGLGARTVIRFLMRRLARIYPLHLFISLLFLINVIALLTASTAKDLGQRYPADYYFLSLFLVQNWGFSDDLAWNIPSWSISTEWFAYLCFPALIWISARIATTTTTALLCALALAGALVATFDRVGATSVGTDIPHLGLFRCVCEFGMGICVFYAKRGLKPATGPIASTIAFALGTAIALATIIGPTPDYVTMPLAFAALVFALCIERAPIPRVLDIPLFYNVGLISYSTYLIHYFVKDWIKFLNVPGAVGESGALAVYLFAVGALSIALYHGIEVPGRVRLNSLIQRRLPSRSAQ